MARDIQAAMLAVLKSPSIRRFNLIKFEFDSGDINLWTGVGDLSWGGDTYTGTGVALGISPIAETQELQANGVDFSLSGLDSSILSLALSEDYQGRPVTMWLGAFDSSKAIVADPVKIFAGDMDVMSIQEDGGTSSVTIAAHSQIRSLFRPSPRVWTAADQKAREGNDTGFDEVPQIQDDPVNWLTG